MLLVREGGLQTHCSFSLQIPKFLDSVFVESEGKHHGMVLQRSSLYSHRCTCANSAQLQCNMPDCCYHQTRIGFRLSPLTASLLAEVLRKVHGAVDNNLKTIWDSLGSNSMFVVVSLGGNTAYTRWLHEMRTKRQTGVAGWPAWSQACESYYLQQLDQSICGCAWANVKQ